MTATSMSRMVVPFMAFVAASSVALVFAVQHVRRQPPGDTKAATAATVVVKPAAEIGGRGPAALAAAKAEGTALATGLAGTRPTAGSGDGSSGPPRARSGES